MSDPIEVELPDGRILEFEAGTSRDVMQMTVRKLLSEPTLTRERRSPGEQTATARMKAESAAVNHPHARVGRLVMRGARALVDPENLPAVGGAVGGLAAAPFTGGMSIPAALALTAGGAAVGGAAGTGVQQQVRQGLHLPTAADLGDAAIEGGKQGALELVGGGIATGARALAPVARRAANTVASKLSASSLKVKPSLVTRNPGIDIPLEAAKAGVIPTAGSARRLAARVSGLGKQIGEAAETSTASIKRGEAARPLRQLLDAKTAAADVLPGDAEVVKRRLAAFLGDETAPELTAMSAKEAHQKAVELGNEIGASFGSPTTSIDRQASKALRAGIRSALAEADPVIASLKSEVAPLKPVQRALNDAIGRTQKWDIGQVIKMGAGGALGGAVGGPFGVPLGALALRAVDSPVAKSGAAAGVYRLGQMAEPAAAALGEGPIPANAARLLREALLAQMAEEPQK